MLQEIKDLQSNAVKQLLNITRNKNQKEITFKAPTGSGKTFMMSDYMNQVLSERNDVIFLVSTLSKADLGTQTYEKFLEYGNRFTNLDPYLINSEVAPEESVYIPDNYNVYVLPRDLYKDKSRIKDSGAMFNFLFQIRFLGKIIYLIRDECHIATSNLDDLNDYFEKVINFSATPKFKPDVEITNEEAVRVKLIKRIAPDAETKEEKNNLFYVNQDDDVEEAVNKFIEIKEDYINKLKVNPCLIIQISNKDKAEEEWAKIKRIVNDPSKNLKWMYIVDDSAGKGSDTNDDVKKLPVSKWKDYVKNKESLVDIIIFKMVITEGWDIPRACMLYQVRDSKSKQMDEQVVGRVRRNPILLDWSQYDEEAQKLAMTCWVWGIVDGNLRKFKKVNVNESKNFEIVTTKLSAINQKKDFDIKEFINQKKKEESINVQSMFDLQRKWNNVSPETEEICWAEINTYEDWLNISLYVDEIEKENNAYMSNYETSLEIDEKQKFSETSYFEISKDIERIYEIENWVWSLNDPDDEEYHFDSKAEKEFAKMLKRFKTIFWGKNYYPNSKIKFEYVLYNKHDSYPDFILKDKNDKIHIFEVKSLDKGYQPGLDEQEYVKKMTELRKMFKVASKVTEQNFYLPIKNEGRWVIYMSENGEETTLSEEQFKNYMSQIT